MKNLLLTSISLILFVFIANSQTENNAYTENFDNNVKKWSILDNENASAKIENGFYIIRNKKADYTYRFWRSVPLNEEEDFIYEAKLKQITGKENYGYGLVWNSQNWENSYNFEVSSNGYYRIYKTKDGTKTNWKEWTKSEHVFPLGSYNILKIEKKDKNLNFYINTEKVYTRAYEYALGEYNGFYLGTAMIVMVDYMKITENEKEINVENAIGGTEKVNMGLKINSPYQEIAPIISADGKTLYVARASDPTNYGTDKSKYDIWYSELQNDGSWSKLKNIGKPLNNEGDNLVISITPDNNTMLVEGVYSSSGKYVSDQGISISYRQQDGSWGIPKEVKIDDFYNLDEYESFCPSPDRKVLVMSIKRRDTRGSKDLYVSFRKQDGTYGTPQNMGDVINTYGNDGTPFIAADGKTLYFYSYGHAGYGSADIFVTRRLDESWMNWSKPKNMGKLVNSFAWDTYFSISAKGDYAYLVSTKNSYGGEDVYKIKLDEETQPEAVVILYGKVYNQKSKRVLGADISYEDVVSGTEMGIATSNAGTGDYKIVLPYGKVYGIIANKKGFMSVSENIDLSKISKYTEIRKDLYLAPIEVGEVVALNNLFFDRGKPTLLKSSYSELDRLLLLLKTNPTMEIELHGHTNNLGPHEQLVVLSNQRAQAVKDYLVKKGIEKNRIKGKGFGPDKPVADNSTEAGRQKNQRVEFKITKK